MSNVSRLFAAVALGCLVTSSWARTDQNSFINRPANTLPELISQVKSDSAVADRFMRHFGKTKEEVIDMFSTFKLGRLPQDGVYLVYNVPGWEEVRSRALFFRKGTLVWTDQQGNPVLKVSCGNPMVRGTDIGVAAVSPSIKVDSSLVYRDLVAQTPETQFIEQTPTVVSPGVIQTNAADVLPATPGVPGVTRSAPFPFILPLTGALLLGLNRGDTNPVPEPCTMLVLGAGAAAFVTRRKLKR